MMFGKKKKKTEMDSWREEEDQPNPTLDPNAHFYRGMPISEEDWRRLIRSNNGVANEHQWPSASGSAYASPDEYRYFNTTGTVPKYDIQLGRPTAHNLEFDVEALWEKMYEHAMAVIVVCPWCGIPQAISNGTCMGCGGVLPKPKPLGSNP